MDQLELCMWDLEPNIAGKSHMWKENFNDWKTDAGKHALLRSHRSKG